MAKPTAAALAALLGRDNRTVVASPDPADPTKVIVFSAMVGEDGDFFGTGTGTDADNDGVVDPTVNVANAYDEGPPPVAAYSASSDPEDVAVAEIYVSGTQDKDFFRTQYFHTGNYDASKPAFGAKRCYVNSKGQPLDANGAPTTVASAVDAETVTLTDVGEAVFNWAQVNRTGAGRTAVPGIYDVSPRQTALYAPYVGWTAQQDHS
jgi:hypothetical protein